jgi:hypothetical protein
VSDTPEWALAMLLISSINGTGRIQVDVSWPPRWIERWNDGHWQFASLTDPPFRASWRQSLVPLVRIDPVLDRVRAILRIGPVLDRVPSTSVSSDSSSDSHPPIAADPTSRRWYHLPFVCATDRRRAHLYVTRGP